jgi:hypothetical protein
MDIDELLEVLFRHMGHTLIVTSPLDIDRLYPPALFCNTCGERIFDPAWTI